MDERAHSRGREVASFGGEGVGAEEEEEGVSEEGAASERCLEWRR